MNPIPNFVKEKTACYFSLFNTSFLPFNKEVSLRNTFRQLTIAIPEILVTGGYVRDNLANASILPKDIDLIIPFKGKTQQIVLQNTITNLLSCHGAVQNIYEDKYNNIFEEKIIVNKVNIRIGQTIVFSIDLIWTEEPEKYIKSFDWLCCMGTMFLKDLVDCSSLYRDIYFPSPEELEEYKEEKISKFGSSPLTHYYHYRKTLRLNSVKNPESALRRGFYLAHRLGKKMRQEDFNTLVMMTNLLDNNKLIEKD